MFTWIIAHDIGFFPSSVNRSYADVSFGAEATIICGENKLVLGDSMQPWEGSADRVLIHTSSYLGFDGEPTSGGRQRFIRDIARLIHDDLGKDVVVLQRGQKAFERVCPSGVPVVGVRCPLGATGDPIQALYTRRVIRPRDRVLYASGEDAWPFFQPGSKAIQHGIWWDGPRGGLTRAVQHIRAIACVRDTISTLCVDTNFINWLRCQGKAAYRLCSKCVYIPNYADLKPGPARTRDETRPLRIICARRYEEKRGFELLVESLRLLRESNVTFQATLFAVDGWHLNAVVARANLADVVAVREESMDGILSRYSEADVAVVPTLWSEGTSLACVEALCSGLPVVATTVGGLGNLIFPGYNGLLVPPTPQAISSALARLAKADIWNGMHNACVSMAGSFSYRAWSVDVSAWLRA